MFHYHFLSQILVVNYITTVTVANSFAKFMTFIDYFTIVTASLYEKLYAICYHLHNLKTLKTEEYYL